jgi:hypothetical protein
MHACSFYIREDGTPVRLYQRGNDLFSGSHFGDDSALFDNTAVGACCLLCHRQSDCASIASCCCHGAVLDDICCGAMQTTGTSISPATHLAPSPSQCLSSPDCAMAFSQATDRLAPLALPGACSVYCREPMLTQQVGIWLLQSAEHV